MATITISAFEKLMDTVVQRTLATDRAYQNAASLEEQSGREEVLVALVEADLKSRFDIEEDWR